MAVLNKAVLTSNITNESGEKVQVSAESNTFRANNMDTDITVSKALERNWVIPKDKITVTTTITNNTDTNIENVYIKDSLGAGASFVSGSLKVGSIDYPDDDPITGVTLPITLGGLGADLEFSYQIEIAQYPEVDTINNSTAIKVTLDEKEYEISSNVATITVLNNEVALNKTGSTTAVKSGDELTYTITITNSGTFKNTEVFFKDPIPEGTTFVENSVKIDGEVQNDLNPEDGFSLKDLNAQQTITVEFKVTIN